jgi:Zn-dependent protease
MTGFRLGRILGIDVHIHRSWLVIAALVMWSMAGTALPADFPEVTGGARLATAALITLLFFLSLLAHELAHSVVAQARGIPVHRITFFLFGGMAQTSADSRSPREEFLIAIAGPAMSVLLAAVFFGLLLPFVDGPVPSILGAVAVYTGGLNAILAIFNLLPGFPMDGGRVLRAVLWKATGDVTRATRWAAKVGGWMALALMGLGLWMTTTGELLGGLWLVLIAFFIRSAARSSYRQHLAGRLEAMARASWEAGYQGHPFGAPGAVPDGAPATGRPGTRDVTGLGRDVSGLGGSR